MSDRTGPEDVDLIAMKDGLCDQLAECPVNGCENCILDADEEEFKTWLMEKLK